MAPVILLTPMWANVGADFQGAIHLAKETLGASVF